MAETPVEDQVAQGTAPAEALEQDEQTDGSTEPARRTARNSQAVYDAARRDRKAKAAVTVKDNAEVALKAKRKAQAKAPTVKGAKSFADRAKSIEKKIAEAHAARVAAEK